MLECMDGRDPEGGHAGASNTRHPLPSPLPPPGRAVVGQPRRRVQHTASFVYVAHLAAPAITLFCKPHFFVNA
jgi:hypothetical protein